MGTSPGRQPYPRQPRQTYQNQDGLPKDLLEKIQLNRPDAELFDNTAKQIAERLNQAPKEANKSAQLRRFFDELVMWFEKAQSAGEKDQQDQRTNEILPLIRMINAKAAYAHGRKLVTPDFTSFLTRCLQQIKNFETLKNSKLLFEAVLGFRKSLEKAGD